MHKLTAHWLLPLMLILHTVAENRWYVFGLRPEVLIYATIIGLAVYVGFNSRYRRFVVTILCIWIVMRVLVVLGAGDSFRQMSFATLAFLFAVVGALIYGKNPIFLHKQLMVYFVLCIPIMILQITGVSQFVQGWNIAYAHAGNVLSLDEVGTFKEVPLFPTLFVGIDKIQYSIGQGRPVGLMYGSNPLSVFVSIFIALNLAIERTSRLRFSDIIVTVMIVLTMARLVFGVTIILYLLFFIFGMRQRRVLVLKLIVLLAIGMSVYYILFPGLFTSLLTQEQIMTSIMLRLGDLWKTAGFVTFSDTINELSYLYRPGNRAQMDGSYSSVAMLLKSDMLILWISTMIFGFLIYLYRVRDINFLTWRVYLVTLFVCILTQFGVPFHKAISFQLILGFALFPLFNKLWMNYLDFIQKS